MALGPSCPPWGGRQPPKQGPRASFLTAASYWGLRYRLSSSAEVTSLSQTRGLRFSDMTSASLLSAASGFLGSHLVNTPFTPFHSHVDVLTRFRTKTNNLGLRPRVSSPYASLQHAGHAGEDRAFSELSLISDPEVRSGNGALTWESPSRGKRGPRRNGCPRKRRRRGRAAGSPGLARAAGLTWQRASRLPGQAGRDSAPALPGTDGPGPPTHPPLLVLLPIHDNHVPLGERQLVWVVSHTVVESFDPLGL